MPRRDSSLNATSLRSLGNLALSIIVCLLLSTEAFYPVSRSIQASAGAIGYAIMLIYLVGILRSKSRSRSSFLFLPSTVFLIVYLVYYPVVGLDKFLSGRTYRYIEQEDYAYFLLMLMAWCGILAFQIGYKLSWRSKNESTSDHYLQDAKQSFRDEFVQFKLWPIILFVFALTALVTNVVDFSLGEGTWYILQNLGKWAVYLAFAGWLVHPSPTRLFLFILLAIPYFVEQLSRVMQNRAETLVPVVGILAMYSIYDFWMRKGDQETAPKSIQANWPKSLIAISIIGAVFFLTSQQRFLGAMRLVDIRDAYQFLMSFFVEGMEYDVKILNDVPAWVDFLKGRSFSMAFLQFVPSALWNSKPMGMIAADSWVVVYLYPMFSLTSRRPPTLIGELYWNFGYWIVPLGMAMCGWMLAKLDVSFVKKGSLLRLLFYASLVSMLVHLIRGPIGNFVQRAMYDFIPLFLIYTVYRVSRQNTSPMYECHSNNRYSRPKAGFRD